MNKHDREMLHKLNNQKQYPVLLNLYQPNCIE